MVSLKFVVAVLYCKCFYCYLYVLIFPDILSICMLKSGSSPLFKLYLSLMSSRLSSTDSKIKQLLMMHSQVFKLEHFWNLHVLVLFLFQSD